MGVGRTRAPVVVVGAGIGGLCAALELAAQGVGVQVVERAAAPGGKARQVMAGGRAIDAGPTVFTMRWVFEELFERLGARLEDHLSLRPARLLARHAWAQGPMLDLHADLATSAEAIGQVAGPAEARGFLAFAERARRTYQALEGPFLRSSRPTPLSLFTRTAATNWRALPDMARISPFATLWSELGQHFRDPRLQQLFGRYATYCGASPFQAPATLMLVAHVEQDGVWIPEGGMAGVARALAGLAEARGVKLRYGSHVSEVLVQGSRACGVRIRSRLNDSPSDDETLPASAVIFNGDSAALAQGLLGEAVQRTVQRPAQRSLSALTWNLLASAREFPLAHHTVFFSRDYAAEFRDLLREQRLPVEPTVYVCAQDRDDGGNLQLPANTPERLLLLVNAPATGAGRPLTESEIERCEQATFEMMNRCGLRLQREPGASVRTTPSDFARMFPGSEGALYGAASHGWRASFQRPAARTRIPGLYLAGGSCHPGPGVPMAALSGRLAAAAWMQDHASTHPCLAMATPGGISMR